MRLFSAAFIGIVCWGFAGTQAFAQDNPLLKFIENRNQWPAHIDYAARVPGGNIGVSSLGFTVVLIDQAKFDHHAPARSISEADGRPDHQSLIDGHIIQLNFVDARAGLSPAALSGRSSEYYNYFIGQDTCHWASRAYAYSAVGYREIYAGIDLTVSSVQENLKYDFIVKPETDPSQIRIEYCGANTLTLDNGNLVLNTVLGDLFEKRPYCYQVINGVKREVESEFVLTDNTVSFHFPDGYDVCEELVIDPMLIFSTYSGSTADNWGSTATPGERGTLYSSGVTNHFVGNPNPLLPPIFSGVFPATPGAFQTSYGGLYDIAILKYDSAGANLMYATYLGGSANETPHSLVMDSATQDLLVLGTTSSTDFPVTSNSYDRTFNSGNATGTNVVSYNNGSDIIVCRISKNGDQLLASTFLGGTGNDGINPTGSALTRNYGDEMRGDILTDKSGKVYISSVTSSANFPALNSLSTVYKGGVADAIVARLTANLDALEWSAFIGGSGHDAAYTLKFDADENLYLAGGTTSSNFPTTPGSYQSLIGGQVDGWIMHLEKDGGSILHSTFTGTSAIDQVYFVDLNKMGEVFVYGQTNGVFPVTPGVYRNPNSGQFVQKFSPQLNTLIFSTVFGSGIGMPNISPTAFLVSECNNLYMSGWGGILNEEVGGWPSSTSGMAVTPDALQTSTSGSDFYFIVLTADATELLYATYLGGNQSRTHVDGGTSRFDKSGIVYHAVCSGCTAFNAKDNGPTSDFPTTLGAWSRTNNSRNCNNAAFKFDLSTLRARLQTNSVAFDAPNLNRICFPDTIRFQNFSTGGEFYEWDLGDGTPVFTKIDTASFLHQYKEEGVYTVTLRAIDQNTCTGVDVAQKQVNVYKNPVTADDADICFGSNVSLVATGGIEYTWRDSTGVVITPDVAPADTARYFIRILDSDGCVHLDTVQVNVVPGVDVKMSYRFITDCFSRPAIEIKNKTKERKDDETFQVNFGDGFTSGEDEIKHYYEADGNYTITLSAQKEFCIYEATVQLPVFTILVPNVITPGAGEGLNDKFIVQYGEAGQTPAMAGLKVILRVFNRWGRKVYESDDYRNDWSADKDEPGIYYYHLTIGDYATCKNWVHVIK